MGGKAVNVSDLSNIQSLQHFFSRHFANSSYWFSILSMLFSLWAYLTYVLLWTIYIPTVFLISTLPGLHSILSVTLQRNLRPELGSVKTSMQGITAKILPASWTTHDQSTQYISLNIFLQTLLLIEQWKCPNICWFSVKNLLQRVSNILSLI